MEDRKKSAQAEKIKEIIPTEAQMSENGDQFIVDGRKLGSTCKLHPDSLSSTETIQALMTEQDKMMGNDFTWKNGDDSASAGHVHRITLNSAHKLWPIFITVQNTLML